jgi:hypothetical protein
MPGGEPPGDRPLNSYAGFRDQPVRRARARVALAHREIPGARLEPGKAGRRKVMAKRHGRPSAQYRYEHYDPRW